MPVLLRFAARPERKSGLDGYMLSNSVANLKLSKYSKCQTGKFTSEITFVFFLLTKPILHFIIQTMTNKFKSTTKVSLSDLPDLLTIREVADLLRVSPLTIKRWGKKGKLPAIRINSRGDRRYKTEVVQRLLGVNPS